MNSTFYILPTIFWFPGGGPDVETLTYGLYLYNYDGCLGGLYLQSRALKLQADAITGFNVLPCNNGHEFLYKPKTWLGIKTEYKISTLHAAF